MEHMDNLRKIKKMLCKEIEMFAEKSRISDQREVELLWKYIDIIKNIGKIEDREDGEGGMSHRGGSYDGASYDDMYSERRGGGRYAKRDNMGRYSSEGESFDGESFEGSYYGYSRDEAKDHIMSTMGRLMEKADHKTREALEEAMRTIRNIK